VKITVLGAGPAGLYLAILLGRGDREHEITVIERNPPDATFGWGVVFSQDSLAALRDADYPTYIEITDTFARWDAIDIHYRGRVLRSRGHSFSAIRRTLLLDILQRRARELGVTLRFHTEVTDPSTVDGSADLVVAADGVNSVLRRASEREFGSVLRPQGCRYVWFGTDLVFDAFTFIFKSTEHGLFQVHAYPFDENRSTFIVECREQVWRAAGLHEASEADSIAFCEKLFADELDGHRLMSNRSLWLSFQRVHNASWHCGRTVLIGDAAHTAHFSIGSGTKLAMEDAIALAGALERHPSSSDLAAALVDYELERQPVVERFQQAADTSAGYFERVAAYTGLAPITFAVNLLTRSGRVSHTNLTLRDPSFGRAADAAFAGQGTVIAPPPLFTPLRLGDTVGDTVVPNRAVVASTIGVCAGEAVSSGAGTVLTELVAVTLEGRVSRETPVVSGVDWAAIADRVHAGGALLAVQLGHAGARGAARPARYGVDVALPAGQAWPLVAASAVRYGPYSAVPRTLDADGMARLCEAFAAGAAALAGAGVDMLELDLAHGRLLAGFLSPLTNHRDDSYGGSLANRLRFPLAVVSAVRAVWPAPRPLVARLTVADWTMPPSPSPMPSPSSSSRRRGLVVTDGIEAARELAAAGVHLVHVEAGQSVAEEQPEYRRGFLTELSDRVRNEGGVPTLVGGYLTTLDEANTVLAAGRADLCLLDLPNDREKPAYRAPGTPTNRDKPAYRGSGDATNRDKPAYRVSGDGGAG
jgi:anthraniloyl-CoA monooxygenase